MRVISLGAGVQSSTLLLMVRDGELEADCAIFADTQWEPRAVYDYLDWLEQVSPIPIHRVSAGNIREEALEPSHAFASMPLYLAGHGGDHGILRRQCTREYKVSPIESKLRQLVPVQPGKARPPGQIDLLMGISLDEVERMKPNRERWIINVYPLIERRMSRHDCLRWLEQHAYPTPPKSACIGCPYHGDAVWRRMQEEAPEEFADAVQFDGQVREALAAQGAVRGLAYLHRARRPLAEVDLATAEDRGQLALFQAECEGYCGV